MIDSAMIAVVIVIVAVVALAGITSWLEYHR